MRNDLDLGKKLFEAIPPIMRSIRATVRGMKGSTLTIQQFRVLRFVSRHSCTNKQLADWQGVSLPAMSRMVDFLARRDLLVRTPSLSDRRQVQLTLSAKGKAEYSRLLNAVEKKLAQRIATLDRSKKAALANGLAVMKELFSDV